jgi:hypothetical protein
MANNDDGGSTTTPRQRMESVLAQLCQAPDGSNLDSIIEQEYGDKDTFAKDLVELYKEEYPEGNEDAETAYATVVANDYESNVAFADRFIKLCREDYKARHEDQFVSMGMYPGKRDREQQDDNNDDGDDDDTTSPNPPKREKTGESVEVKEGFFTRNFRFVKEAVLNKILPPKPVLSRSQPLTASQLYAREKVNLKYRERQSVSSDKSKPDNVLFFINFLASFMVRRVNDVFVETYAKMLPVEVDPRNPAHGGVSIAKYKRIANPSVGDPHDYPLRVHANSATGCIMPFTGTCIMHDADIAYNNESVASFRKYLMEHNNRMQTLALVESSDYMWTYPKPKEPVSASAMYSLICTTPWQLYRLTPTYGMEILNNRLLHGSAFGGLRESSNDPLFFDKGLKEEASSDQAIVNDKIDGDLATDSRLPTNLVKRREHRDSWALCNFVKPNRQVLFDPTYAGTDEYSASGVRNFMELQHYPNAASKALARPMPILFEIGGKSLEGERYTYSIQSCHYGPAGYLETSIVTDIARAMLLSKWYGRFRVLHPIIETAYGREILETSNSIDNMFNNQKNHLEIIKNSIRNDEDVLAPLYERRWDVDIMDVKESQTQYPEVTKVPYIFMYFPQETLSLRFPGTGGNGDDDDELELNPARAPPDGLPASMKTRDKQLLALLQSLRQIENWLFDPKIPGSMLENLVIDDPKKSSRRLLGRMKRTLLSWYITLDDASEKTLRSGVIREDSITKIQESDPFAKSDRRVPISILKRPPGVPNYVNGSEDSLMAYLKIPDRDKPTLTIYGIAVFVNMATLTALDTLLPEAVRRNLRKALSEFDESFNNYIGILRNIYLSRDFTRLTSLPSINTPIPSFFKQSLGTAPAAMASTRIAQPPPRETTSAAEREGIAERALDTGSNESASSAASVPSAIDGGGGGGDDDDDDDDYDDDEAPIVTSKPGLVAPGDGMDMDNADLPGAITTAAAPGDTEGVAQPIGSVAATTTTNAEVALLPEHKSATTTTTTASEAAIPPPASDNSAARAQFIKATLAAANFTSMIAQNRSLRASESYDQECAKRVDELQARERRVTEESVKALQAERDQLRIDMGAK